MAKHHLSRSAYDRLKAEFDDLTTRGRIEVANKIETARLMGLSDDYKLPKNYNEAYHLTGDGLVVDVVRHLAQHILEPLLAEPLEARAVA